VSEFNDITGIPFSTIESSSISPSPIPQIFHQTLRPNNQDTRETLNQWCVVIAGVHRTVVSWMDDWGPLENWPTSILGELKAVEADEIAMINWMREMRHRAEYAKVLLVKLNMFFTFPYTNDELLIV